MKAADIKPNTVYVVSYANYETGFVLTGATITPKVSDDPIYHNGFMVRPTEGKMKDRISVSPVKWSDKYQTYLAEAAGYWADMQLRNILREAKIDEGRSKHQRAEDNERLLVLARKAFEFYLDPARWDNAREYGCHDAEDARILREFINEDNFYRLMPRTW